MDLQVLIAESDATLRNPAFATGFGLTLLVVAITSIRTAIEIGRPQARPRHLLFFAFLLFALALSSRFLISMFANIVDGLLLGNSGTVHYWGVGFYAYAVWASGALAFVLTMAWRRLVLATDSASP
jgi:hypothetical protein